MSTVAKYLDKYSKRHKSPTPEKQDFHKMMTDRQAYISYLEVQLERVTQACLQSQGFNERIEQVQTQLNTSEEKILNITRLVKLQQNYSENQEEEFNTLKEKVDSLGRSGGKDLQIDDLKVTCRKQEGRIESIENRIKGYEDRLSFLMSQSQRDDAARVGHYDEYARELDRSIKDTEHRIMTLLEQANQDLEEKHKLHTKQIEAAIDACSRDLTSDLRDLEKRMNDMRSSQRSYRTGILKGSKEPTDYVADDLNDRLSTIENELRQYTTKMNNLEGISDLLAEEAEIRKQELQDITETAWNAEKTCNRLAEDVLNRVMLVEEDIREVKKQTKTVGFEKLSERERGGSPKRSENYEAVEKKLTNMVTSAVDRVTDLVKEYMESHRDLQRNLKSVTDRVRNLEDRQKPPVPLTNISTPPKSPKSIMKTNLSPRFLEPEKDSTKEVEKAFKDLETLTIKKDDRPRSAPPRKRSKSFSIDHSSGSIKNRSLTPRSKSPVRTETPRGKPALKSARNLSPSTTLKSKAMEATIKEKLKAMRQKEEIDKRAIEKTLKKGDTRRTKDRKDKKRQERRSKLEKVISK